MDNFQTGTLAILFTSLRVRENDLILELADSLLQPTVALYKGGQISSGWREKGETIHTSL